jgi:hypothetical protein
MHEQRSEDGEEQEDREHQSGLPQRSVASCEPASQGDQFGEHEEAETHPLPEHGVLWGNEFPTGEKGRDRQSETGKCDPETGFPDAGRIGLPW